MNTEDRIKDLENDIKSFFDENSLNSFESINEYLRKSWNKAKSDENLLAQAIKVNRNSEGKATDICSPIISSLILLDHENVDPLIYETLLNIIYNNPIIASIPNYLIANKSYSFLISTLFNQELKLSNNRMSLLINEATQYYDKIKEFFTHQFTGLIRLNSLYRQYDINSNQLENTIDEALNELNTILNEKKNNIHFANAPADIRYFIYTHPMFSNIQEDSKWSDYFKKFFIFEKFIGTYYYDKLEETCDALIASEQRDYNNFNLLLEDAGERIKIRKYTKMPF